MERCTTKLSETDGLIRVPQNTLGKANEYGHAGNERRRVTGQVECGLVRMVRLSDVTWMCLRIATSELIGYGNRTLLNGSGEISFCQRRPNLGSGERTGPEMELCSHVRLSVKCGWRCL